MSASLPATTPAVLAAARDSNRTSKHPLISASPSGTVALPRRRAGTSTLAKTASVAAAVRDASSGRIAAHSSDEQRNHITSSTDAAAKDAAPRGKHSLNITDIDEIQNDAPANRLNSNKPIARTDDQDTDVFAELAVRADAHKRRITSL